MEPKHQSNSVDLSRGFEQTSLVVQSTITEDAHGLFCYRFSTMEREIQVDDLSHTSFNLFYISLGGWLSVGLLEIAEVSA